MGVVKNGLPCENFPVLLYPLYLLNGCRKEDSAHCTTVQVVDIPVPLQHRTTTAPPEKAPVRTEIPVSTQHNTTTAPPEKAPVRTEIPVSMQPNSTAVSPEKPPESNIANNIISDDEEEEMMGSWISSLMNWLWNSRQSSRERQPCVWGNCNFLTRPHLPWGIKMQHQPLPATIESPYNPSDTEQGLAWDSEIVV